MFKYFIVSIYLILFSNTHADNREKVIQKLQNTKNLVFEFEQNINGKIENGNCIIQYPKKIYCEYLKNNKICLSGFSQGCMMSLNLGLTSDQEFSCIVGFSGKIINQEDLKARKKISTSTLLIHGDSDQVVSPNFMLEAKDFFIRNKIEIETHLIENCDHHIPIQASSIALNYILKKI